MITKKKELSIEQLKQLGIADFYGNIDGRKFRRYAEEQNAEGYDIVVVGDSMKDGHNILDNEPVVYGDDVIHQDVKIIKENTAAGDSDVWINEYEDYIESKMTSSGE